MMKWVSGGMALLFIAWATFQYNDPDPFVWILVYGLASLASVLYLIKRLPLAFPLIYCIAGLAWALYTSTTITYEPPLIEIEAWREMMGVVVASGWMGVLAWVLFRVEKIKVKAAAG